MWVFGGLVVYALTPHPPPPLTHAPESPLDWLLTNSVLPSDKQGV